MLALDESTNLLAAYREGVRAFLRVLDEEESTLSDCETFAVRLNLALTRFGLSASKLSKDEQISRAAISKWMNGQAFPPPPTRKTVVNWIKDQLEEELKQSRLQLTPDDLAPEKVKRRIK